ncbi:MAG: proton-conducting transporter membrane subunit [Bdellovibrionota bacterium]
MYAENSIVVNSLYPLSIFIYPIILIACIYIFRKLKIMRDFFMVFTGFMLTLISILFYQTTSSNFIYTTDLFELLKNGRLSFLFDASGTIFFMIISILWTLTSIYSIGYMRTLKERSQNRFYSFFALAIFASIGICFSKNLLTLFIFYEILSISTYPLVTHHQDKASMVSGRKYLGYILGGSIGLVLPAIVYIYLKTGTLDFTANGILANANFSSLEIFVLLSMFLFGFAKAAVMPMHAWLPNAMVAPTPVSALLHAVAVVKSGVFSIYRVVAFIFGTEFLKTQKLGTVSISLIFCTVVSITIILGALMALNQDNLKKRLAYSTISQLSYVLLGIFALNPYAISGALFYLVSHAFAKITLFFIVGVILVSTGKERLSEIGGLGYKMPITFICFFIASLALVGLPPSGGFLAKYMLLEGMLWENKIAFLIVYLVSSFLALIYLFPILFKAFEFDKSSDKSSDNSSKKEVKESPLIRKVPMLCMFSIVATTLISLLLFFYSDLVTNITFQAVYQMVVKHF